MPKQKWRYSLALNPSIPLIRQGFPNFCCLIAFGLDVRQTLGVPVVRYSGCNRG